MIPLPRNSEQPPMRPPAAVELAVERLLVRLRARQPTALGVEDPPPRRHGIRARREVAGRATQEPRLEARVRVEHEDHVAAADLRLSGRQGRTLAVRKALATSRMTRVTAAMPHSDAAARTASPVPSVDRSSTTTSSKSGWPPRVR